MRLAHRFALENEKISADCIESTEFPDLAARYSVYAVPRTIVNDAVAIEGAVPETHFLDGVLKSLEPEEEDGTPG